MRVFPTLIALGLAGCATSNSPEPSLAPRAAEAIDPRLPIASAPIIGPTDPALAARLATLIVEGNAGVVTFASEVAKAEALAAAAGPKESESWIVAQQALSGLEAARAASTRALSEIDAIAATRIQSGAGVAPGDLAAIEAAAEGLRRATDRQDRALDAIGARLAR